jgi:hypothetical protein
MDSTFSPSGRAYPAVHVGLDLVDPTSIKERRDVDEDKTFPRFRAEVAMKSKLGMLFDEVVWFSAAWRYYREIDADSEIRNLDLDQSSYFVIVLDLPKGLFVSYATGKLPLDQDEDDVLELGFKIRF